MLMITAYTLFSLSGTQPQFVELLGSTPFDESLKLVEKGPLSYSERILLIIHDIVIHGKEEFKQED
jgi:hypothetical protein